MQLARRVKHRCRLPIPDSTCSRICGASRRGCGCLMTGHASATAQLPAMRLGALIVSKPADPDEIIRATSGKTRKDEED